MDATIRVVHEADAGAIAAIYAPIVEATHISFETTPPSAAEMRARIRDGIERFPWIVCEVEGTVVGYAYARPHNDRPAYQWGVDVSVYVDEGWRRTGVARGLYESLFEILRRQGFFTAYALIALPNQPSVSLHESLAFERVGHYERAGYKHGAWYDVGHWQLTLQPHETPPDPPIPFAEFRTADAFEHALRTGEPTIRRE